MNGKITIYNRTFFKDIYEKKGITIQQIADIIGCSPNKIIQFENNKHATLKIDQEKWEDFAGLMGLDSQYLYIILCNKMLCTDKNKTYIDGKALRAIRTEKDYRQDQLAEIIGCTPQNISKIELAADKPTLIDKDTMEKIAKVFNIDPLYLYPPQLPISNSEIHNSHKELVQFVDRLFYDNSTLRKTDLLYFRNLMSALGFDTTFIDNTTKKINANHKSAQKEIPEFVNRISNNQSPLREGDIFILRSILKKLDYQKGEERPDMSTDDIPKTNTVNNVSKIEQKIEEIKNAHNNNILPDCTIAPRISPFIKPSIQSYADYISQELNQIQDREHLFLIDMVVNHLNDFDQSQMNIIKCICKSSESFSYKKYAKTAHLVRDELLDWFFIALMPDLHEIAYELIFSDMEKFDILEKKKDEQGEENKEKSEKQKYLESIYSNKTFLLDSFQNSFNEVINYHLSGKQDIKNSIYYWVYTTLIPRFLTNVREEIYNIEIDINEEKKEELLREIKSQSSQLQQKFINALIKQIEHFCQNPQTDKNAPN